MNYALNFVGDSTSNQTIFFKVNKNKTKRISKDKRGIARHKNFQEVRSFQK